MGQFIDDPAELLAVATDWSALPDYQKAAVGIGATEPAWQETIISNIHGHCVQFRLFHQEPVTSAAISKAVDGILNALKAIDQSLETILDARISAPSNAPDREAVLLTLYPSVLEALFPGKQMPGWDSRDRGHAPHRGEIVDRVDAICALVDQLEVHKLQHTTRPLDPAFDQLIHGMASVYQEVTGQEPSADHDGNRPDYRSPFARFFITACASILKPIPGNQRIHDALRRSRLLRDE